MKQLFTLCFVFIAFITFSQDKVEPTYLTFETTSHDFGKIPDSEDAFFVFKFKNTSGQSLVLNPPKSSCGCTIPSYPKEPIAAGEEQEIKVKYSTSNRIGRFNKDVKVYAQGFDDPIILRIRGEVVSPQESSTLPKKESNSLFK